MTGEIFFICLSFLKYTNCTRQDNWILSTTIHNWTTEYSQQWYTTDYWIQSTTGCNRTTEYSQQAYPSKQLDTVNNRAQLNNKRTTKYTEQMYTTTV